MIKERIKYIFLFEWFDNIYPNMKRKHNSLNNVHLAIFFKDFAAWIRSSCVGLNVAGFTTAKYLKEHGIDTTVFPVRHNVDIVRAIDHYNETHIKRLTHVVISAPWLSLHDMKNLVRNFSDIQFVCEGPLRL